MLRTDRRTEKDEGATLVNAKGGLLLQQSIRRHAQEYVYGAKCSRAKSKRKSRFWKSWRIPMGGVWHRDVDKGRRNHKQEKRLTQVRIYARNVGSAQPSGNVPHLGKQMLLVD